MATEHLKPQRVLSQSEDTLLLGLRTIDHRAVSDLLGRLNHTQIVSHSRRSWLFKNTHAALHESAQVAQDNSVNLHPTLGRIAHGEEHGLPRRVLAQPNQWFRCQAVSNHIRRTRLDLHGQLNEI